MYSPAQIPHQKEGTRNILRVDAALPRFLSTLQAEPGVLSLNVIKSKPVSMRGNDIESAYSMREFIPDLRG